MHPRASFLPRAPQAASNRAMPPPGYVDAGEALAGAHAPRPAPAGARGRGYEDAFGYSSDLPLSTVSNCGRISEMRSECASRSAAAIRAREASPNEFCVT